MIWISWKLLVDKVHRKCCITVWALKCNEIFLRVFCWSFMKLQKTEINRWRKQRKHCITVTARQSLKLESPFIQSSYKAWHTWGFPDVLSNEQYTSYLSLPKLSSYIYIVHDFSWSNTVMTFKQKNKVAVFHQWNVKFQTFAKGCQLLWKGAGLGLIGRDRDGRGWS